MPLERRDATDKDDLPDLEAAKLIAEEVDNALSPPVQFTNLPLPTGQLSTKGYIPAKEPK